MQFFCFELSLLALRNEGWEYWIRNETGVLQRGSVVGLKNNGAASLATEACFEGGTGSCYWFAASGSERDVAWSLGGGAVTGGVTEGVPFNVDEVGELTRTTRCATSPPTVSPAPTSGKSRTMVETARCFEAGCRFGSRFDTSAFADQIGSAFLWIDAYGDLGEWNEYVEVYLNEDQHREVCGSSFDGDCATQRCVNFDGLEVTDAARTGELRIAYEASSQVDAPCGTDGNYDGTIVQATATLVVFLDETPYPTPGPSSSPRPSTPPSPAPTSYAIRTLEATLMCVGNADCGVATFDLSHIVGGAVVARAALTIKVAGYLGTTSRFTYAVVTVDGEPDGTCGEDFAEKCVATTCPAYDEKDVTAAVVRHNNNGGTKLAVGVTIRAPKSHGYFNEGRLPYCGLEEFTLRADLTLDVELVPSPGGELPRPSSAPSTTLLSAPPSTTDVSTFADLASAISSSGGSGGRLVRGWIPFDSQLAVGEDLRLVGEATTDAIFDGQRSTALLSVRRNSTLHLEALTLQNGQAEEGGCVDVVGSRVVLRDVVAKNCAAKWSGGAFFLESSSLVAYDSVFQGNSAVIGGGAIHLLYGSTADVERCDLRENYAGEDGAVAIVWVDSTFVATDSTFLRNLARNDGAVVDVARRSTFRTVRSNYTANDAGDYGSVAYLYDHAAADATDCVFEANYAGAYGGVLLATVDVTITTSSCVFRDNFAGTDAAVVALYDASTATATNCSFERNVAGLSSGVAFVYGSSKFAADDCLFSHNVAFNRGGNVVLADSSTFSTTNSSFRGYDGVQLAQDGELAYLTQSSTLEVYNASLRNYRKNAVRCLGTGVIYGAVWDVDLTAGFFDIDENCVLQLYETNNNGSSAYRDEVIESNFFSGTVNFVHWSRPCGPGTWSSDGIEHGDRRDGNGRTIDENDPFCAPTAYPFCAEPCQTCPEGRFNEFSLNRFQHLGVDSCTACPVGTFLEDAEQRWWLHDHPDDCVPCAPGKHASEPGSAECEVCPNGTFASRAGSIGCSFIDPGFFVPPGVVGAEPEPCSPGTFSVGAAAACEDCPRGEFQPESGKASCKACPSPMTTRHPGSLYCDACVSSYFWNSIVWENDFSPGTDGSSERQCVECCWRCEDICDVDEEDCVRCDGDDGAARLETLYVESGWWRPTNRSLKIYECPYDRSCAGGSSVEESQQCKKGHVGALCGACDTGYDYNVAENRCAPCERVGNVWPRAGSVVLVLVVVGLTLRKLCAWRKKKKDWHWQAVFLCLKEGAREEELTIEVVDDVNETIDASQSERERMAKRRLLRKYLLSKLKIVLAAWQIAASTEHVLFQVRLPAIFGNVMRIFSVIGVFFLDFGTFDCFFRWTYFDQLLVVTLLPLVIVPLAAALYWCVERARGKFDREAVVSNIKYATLLFLYVILPSISTYVITYFSCSRFDRGDRSDLRVIAAQLSINCRGKRYRRWAIYAAIAIAAWPVGATLGLAVLLFRNRRNLNPPLGKYYRRKKTFESEGGEDADAFLREQRRHGKAIGQLARLKIRNEDPTIKGLQFLFEDYEPRCYLFPIFELVRRLFLTSVLAVFYPGSMQQVVVGVLGAMLSYVVYAYYEAYIKDDDDVVAIVAQGQLVLIYFFSLAVYTSDVAEQKRSVFSGVAFGALLVAIFFASFVVAIYVTLLEIFGDATLRHSYRHASTRARALSGSLSRSLSRSFARSSSRLLAVLSSEESSKEESSKEESSKEESSKSDGEEESKSAFPDVWSEEIDEEGETPADGRDPIIETELIDKEALPT